MSSYKFIYEDKEYSLKEDNCSALINDEESPIQGISIPKIIEILNESEEVDFDIEYYQEACPLCLEGVKEKKKFFPFLEYHFYIFSKDGKYVISNISNDYKGMSFNKLSRANKVDNSYIVSVIICENCQDYIIQIENCIV
ncbi:MULTISPECIES: DUF3785 domain-containing protein [unclassified Clostridioides]|uniref:DUF3785 domain-containing protein n=1 Tax=unclassified Clostridioides TaxID=2635829 RepID=UPI001D12B8CF|nr:DUF3785 domain-containing protein [Clostridioides sp. ZZV14-6150]MCC0660232.1 DUF3785 domain-containing protein [Clostridioides sp. ZZV14-6154]MCC0667419.1 DUF3785 domain-containing protein [Clostridioides sp. ZZV14-6153]MCC0720968.1 DUF3785 domain-containing protein [Clostridioides sp. ZZV14-6104]MCC0741223.1 DUF3785 domain-containing protein [Clostridioides sp. ZZV14-6044]MCC0749404.1 DUF3785 domain-containing protein [Clostridioides sp. ZZV13-5731]WLD28760.1 hypothetical protein CDIFMA2